MSEYILKFEAKFSDNEADIIKKVAAILAEAKSEVLLAENQALHIRVHQAEACIRAMWPVFVSAIDFVELSSGKLKSLEDTCRSMIQRGDEYNDILDMVTEIAEKGGDE